MFTKIKITAVHAATKAALIAWSLMMSAIFTKCGRLKKRERIISSASIDSRLMIRIVTA